MLKTGFLATRNVPLFTAKLLCLGENCQIVSWVSSYGGATVQFKMITKSPCF